MAKQHIEAALELSSTELSSILSESPLLQGYLQSVALPQIGHDAYDITWVMHMQMGLCVISGRCSYLPPPEVVVTIGWACKPHDITADDLKELRLVFARNGKTAEEAMQAYRDAKAFFKRECTFH